MDENTRKAISRIEDELVKIDKGKNKVYFFVIDTKGVPSGSLEYIYSLAMFASEEGYNVEMLYAEDDFEGVGSWLGEKYASLPHQNINSGETETSASDVLFIPEIFARVMNQTKDLPCKKVAILQNYDYMVDQMPYSAQWGDFKVFDAIVNTDRQASLIKSVFPYVRTHKVTPFVSDIFGTTQEPKKMTINIVAQDQADVNRVVKPFYWKYPLFRWVSFKDLRGLPKERFASELREGAITIWLDPDCSFGYAPLEAMKSGGIVMAKMPNNSLEWAEEDGKMKNCCVWFTDFEMLHKQIASVVRSWITDTVPSVIYDVAKETVAPYQMERTKKEFMDLLTSLVASRKGEMEALLEELKNKE